MTTRKTLDQTFTSLKSKLETTAAPYDPFGKTGDPNDPAQYIKQPGVEFLRPWLAIRNGPAFQWPLGLEGYTLEITPELGIHKFIGDNAVTVDVIHAGEEHFTMNGSFPGNSAPLLMQALRDLVYQGAPAEGKILYIPEIMTHAQRVQVVSFSGSRTPDDRGRDAQYTIEFVRLGVAAGIKSTQKPIVVVPSTSTTSASVHSIHVDAKHNSLRKIATWKFGDASEWRTIYNKNQKFFVKNNIPLAKAPDHRINVGVLIYF